MNKLFIFLILVSIPEYGCSQRESPSGPEVIPGTNSMQDSEHEIHILIDTYTQAREASDTALLESILTPDIDQLVSSGTWRRGKQESMTGMLRSSESNPGTRSLIIEKIRFVQPDCAIVDARYEIQNADGTLRKMWSTFIVVRIENRWKISAIRNMLPS